MGKMDVEKLYEYLYEYLYLDAGGDRLTPL